MSLKSLVIVESPSKARTISKYLGKDYQVKASVGHVVDLSDKTHDKIGVDISNGFKPDYEVIKGKGKILKELRRSAREKEKVYLATDPDREGEAIAWHIAKELDLGKRAHRVLIREITKEGVIETFRNSGELNRDKFEAQQARRILDRIVGYKISPLLWKKIGGRLSAGRVQSVALNFIVRREREIDAFTPREYWKLEARLLTLKDEGFSAYLQSFEDCSDEIPDGPRADEIVAALKGERFRVKEVEKKKHNRKAPPPFITSTLQRDASTRLGFSVRKTMTVAQRLYEGIDLGDQGPVGLITYMRTDSVRLSSRAVEEARSFIKNKWGDKYLPSKPPVQKVKKDAQDAHEAIRATSADRTPQNIARFLQKDEARLYELIWRRFIASQMTSAVDERTTVDIEAGKAVFRAVGTVPVFAGWREVIPPQRSVKGEDEPVLPLLARGDELRCEDMIPSQHFTKPPPRYNESSLVKELEDKGVGRPSTYASILSTIQEREYVRMEKKVFFPTSLGISVNDCLVKNFPNIMDETFTASVEEDLDRIEQGTKKWDKLLNSFYFDEENGLQRRLEDAEKSFNIVEETDITCDKCGKPMIIKQRRRIGGEFLSCSGYPECKNASDFERDGDRIVIKKASEPKETDIECEKCGSVMVIKTRRRDGAEFLACSGYPKCRNAASFERDGDSIRMIKSTGTRK